MQQSHRKNRSNGRFDEKGDGTRGRIREFDGRKVKEITENLNELNLLDNTVKNNIDDNKDIINKIINSKLGIINLSNSCYINSRIQIVL